MRAYSEAMKKVYQVTGIEYDLNGTLTKVLGFSIKDDDKTIVEVENPILLYPTGLLDSNRVPVYTNDLVKDEAGIEHIVRYDKECLCFYMEQRDNPHEEKYFFHDTRVTTLGCYLPQV